MSAAIAAALSLPPDHRVGLGGRARRHAQSFSTEAMQRATLDLYDRLLT
jgi:hypothetical protein